MSKQKAKNKRTKESKKKFNREKIELEDWEIFVNRKLYDENWKPKFRREVRRIFNDFLDYKLKLIVSNRLKEIFQSKEIEDEMYEYFKREMQYLLKNAFDRGLKEGIDLKEGRKNAI